MFTTDIQAHRLVQGLSELEKSQFPYALVQATNAAAWDTRTAWHDEIPKVFDRPTPMTRRAVLYKKATLKTLYAEIFLRDESAGTPPVKYLMPNVFGGPRLQKPFEKLLVRRGIMRTGEWAVPGRGVRLDAFGNVPGSVIKAVISDVQAARDVLTHSTVESRRRRSRRKKGASDVYFYTPGGHGDLPRGIYARAGREHHRTGATLGIRVRLRSIFMFVRSGDYDVLFDAYGLAEQMFNSSFPPRFREHMDRAVKATIEKYGPGGRPSGRRR